MLSFLSEAETFDNFPEQIYWSITRTVCYAMKESNVTKEYIDSRKNLCYGLTARQLVNITALIKLAPHIVNRTH